MSIWHRLGSLLGGGGASAPVLPPPPPPPEPVPPAPRDPSRQSIYAFLRAQPLDADGKLPDEAAELPDDEAFWAGIEIRWAPGAQDGVFGHHMAPDGGDRAEPVFAALKEAMERPAPEAAERRLYALLLEGRTLHYVDRLAGLLADDPATDGRRVAALALRLATGSPDREPVKLGIALLGLVRGPDNTGLFMTLGKHDEFTLFSAIALANRLPDDERDRAWWELARAVDGWGRVHLVERLARTSSPEIRRWLLREGFRNSVMDEYLAYDCAAGGGLLEELNGADVDDELLLGAAKILQALIRGGPAEDMADYADGPAATFRYLGHVLHRARPGLVHLPAVGSIRDFADEETGRWAEREIDGWTPEFRRRVRARTDEILSRRDWPDLVREGLGADDNHTFWLAETAAPRLGIDPFFDQLRRQRSGLSDSWFTLMQTDDPDRIDRVLRLAGEQLDLAAIASGPTDSLGLGAEFKPHCALDFILQGLTRFPGKGWPFVAAGLRSPTTRNRNMALRVLDAWGRERWPVEAEPAVRAALAEEPNAGVRRWTENLLAGRPLEEGEAGEGGGVQK